MLCFSPLLSSHSTVARNIKKALKDDIIKPYQQKGFDMSKSTMVEEGGLQDRLPDIRVKAGETFFLE